MALLRTQIGRKFQGTAGDVISGATAVIVALPSSATATVYASESGTTTIAQPILTGIDGGLAGWLEIGDYNITVTSPSGTVSSRYYSTHPQQSYLETISGSDVPLTIKAGTAQSVPLAEFQNSSGSVVASITAVGSVTSPTITSIQGSITSVQGSVTAIQGSVTATQGSVTNTQGSVTATQGSVTSVSGTVSTLSGSVTALAGTVAGQEVRIGAIEANSWVTTARINNGAVTAEKLATDATAMNLLAGTVFSTAGTTSYTLPAKAEVVVVEFIGAGGGGGNGSGGVGGAGGNGGEWTRETYAATELGTAALTVVVGAGGVAGNAGGWSQFGSIYWPGARPGVGSSQGGRGVGIAYGNTGVGGAPSGGAGYRGFKGGGGGGAGGNTGAAGGNGGKGLDTPANIWPTANTQSVTGATGGGANGGANTVAGSSGSAGTGNGGGGGGASAVGGNGGSPGGGGGGGGANTTGGTGGNAQISVWVYG